MNASERFASLRKGLLEFAVLSTISAHEAYVADLLATLASTDFQTQNGPPRKYYSLTEKGTRELEATQAYWKELISTLKSLSSKR